MESYRHDGAATPRDVTRIIGDTPSEASSPAPSSFEGSEPAFSPLSFALLLKKLVLHPDSFTLDDTRAAFYHLASPTGASAPQIGAFLSALRLTGKDGQPSVVAACADVMQRHALAVDVGRHGEGPVCDIVGTGGDGQNTFNVSTTAGIVAAGAGCRVYKHGNKAATSSSGSADILLSLGCPVTTLPASTIPTVASQSPFLFLYAPNYHPAMVRVAPIRKQLGFPTVFNALGPLINPARPGAMIVGVHSRFLGPIFAEALKITGVERAWVVCGAEGLDEISPAGETYVWDLKDHIITERTISPLDFGLPLNPISTVAGGTPLENAATLDLLLDDKLGPNNPIENFVALNTAALLVVAGRAGSPIEGVEMARKSIAEGRAKEALAKFRKASQENAESVPV
ncbi:anthranilate phosphoribosyltransferase [Leucosporidium creatinivorum]|uniref:Anthranilate phosphoribosyltransferase n=1 Tax=Leucosporidium creatinivorum TaxID=106004 RepID=A0A1Y2EXA2_9BASI|nr:anthranilate phosphoribosyltransferase [Leucosporidium creatinivorum]